jgi:hypothetical protein
LVLGVSAAKGAVPEARAGANGHIEQQCLAPSMVGNGCAVKGVIRWVDDTPHDTPEWVKHALQNCFIGGMVGLAEVYLAPPQAKLVWMAVDCVEHVVADAILTGGR